MKPRIKVNFAYFWPDFTPAEFGRMFPSVSSRYELELSSNPEVLFYSNFIPNNLSRLPDGRYVQGMPVLPQGDYLRVFLTGENIEPFMDRCDFAISFSALIDHPNHLRLPVWVYGGRRFGFTPESILKRADTDWEAVAAGKTQFCNFIYTHDVRFRNDAFALLSRYKHIDAPGDCMNNMKGWLVPGGQPGKIEFMRPYKFSLAVENAFWPGYHTEKLVDAMFASSIPIYIGDPLAAISFDTASYIDFCRFASLKEMFDFVREVDNDRNLYLEMLAAPYYRGNQVPNYARDETVLAFFDRIFAMVGVTRSLPTP